MVRKTMSLQTMWFDVTMPTQNNAGIREIKKSLYGHIFYHIHITSVDHHYTCIWIWIWIWILAFGLHMKSKYLHIVKPHPNV